MLALLIGSGLARCLASIAQRGPPSALERV